MRLLFLHFLFITILGGKMTTGIKHHRLRIILGIKVDVVDEVRSEGSLWNDSFRLSTNGDVIFRGVLAQDRAERVDPEEFMQASFDNWKAGSPIIERKACEG